MSEKLVEPNMRPGKLFVVHLGFGGYAFCGTRNHYRLSGVEEDVSCQRCIEKIASQDVP